MDTSRNKQKKNRLQQNAANGSFLARPEGFEPPTFRIGICYAIQLRYGR